MADYNAKGLQDKENNNLNFTPTNFMDAQGNSKSIEVEFGKKQNTLSLEADSADIDDSTTIVKTLDGAKLKTALAVKFWNYIKGKISSVLGLTVTNYGGTANTATNYNTSSGTIKTTLEGKSSTTHTHSVSINGSTKTIAASGGTAVDLGTYKVFNYAKVYATQTYDANTNRYILLAFKAATYTNNWEESSMFKLVVHDGLVPQEFVFRLWLKGNVSSGVVPADPSDPKLYRVYSDNFSESELDILDVRLFVVEKSAGSITFTIGIFIDRYFLQSRWVSYQLYPLSYGTRDRGNTIDNGLSSWTYTVGHDIYSDLHNSFTTAFDVSELPIRMNVVDAYELEYLTGPITSLNPLKLPSNIICPDGYAPQPGGSYIALSQFVQNKTHRFELWEPMSESVWLYNNLGVTIVYRTVNSMGYIEYDVLPQEVIILNRGGNRVKPTSAWATLIGTNLYVTFGY
jgi:hypothetical protein